MNPPTDMRGRFGDALEASVDDIVAKIVERSEAEIEVYAYLRRAGSTSLSTNAHKHLARLAESIRAGHDSPTSSGLAFELAYDRAMAGLPLSSIMRVWAISTRVVWDWFIDTVHDWGPTAHRELWPLWLSYVDEVTHRSTEAYLAWQQSNQEKRLEAQRRFMSDLVRGRLGQLEGHRRLTDLGMNLDHGLHVSVLTSSTAGQPIDADVLSRLTGVLRDASARLGTPTLLVPRDVDVVILHPQIAGTDTLDWTRHLVQNAAPGLLCGIVSDVVYSIADLRSVVEQGEFNARAAAWGGVVVRAGELRLLDYAVLLLASDFEKYRPQFLDLLPQRGATHDWMDTVIAWAESGWNPPTASKALHVHTNTVHYRLAQIESRTGLDLSQPQTAISVYLTARILRAQERSRGASQ